MRSRGPTASTFKAVCAEGEPSRFVLPFFFAIPGHEGDSERSAAGHLEIPYCSDNSVPAPVPASNDRTDPLGEGITLRLLAGGPLEDVAVIVLDPRTGDTIARQECMTLLTAGDYASLGIVNASTTMTMGT